jgi:methanogenic corrinoid protein MtbC1
MSIRQFPLTKGEAMDSLIAEKLANLEEEAVAELVRAELAAGTDPLLILGACRDGMLRVGQRYEQQEYFVSDLMMAGEIFKQATNTLGSALQEATVANRGTVVVGTVKGDIHDIGKDLVVALLRAAGFAVADLGVDVAPERFVAEVKETGATVLGLSGLLTVGYDAMRSTVAALQAAGLRPAVRVMIGGGPINDEVRKYTGADAWGADAQAAVALAGKWLEA